MFIFLLIVMVKNVLVSIPRRTKVVAMIVVVECWQLFTIFPQGVNCSFISVLDEFKMLVSGEAKASVEKFLEDDHSFEEYTNVSNLLPLLCLVYFGDSLQFMEGGQI